MKAVLFDLDETLLDRTVSLRNFVTEQAKGLVTDTEVECFVRRFLTLDANGAVWKDAVYDALVAEFEISAKSSGELLADYLARFRLFCLPKPGALEALQTLHTSGLQLGLVSNGRSPFQEHCFEALGLAHLFDDVVISGAVGCSKPDRDIFLLSCNNLGVHPEQAIFVGDNPLADIQGANAVGMHTIYVPGSFGADCADADMMCPDLTKLPALIKVVC